MSHSAYRATSSRKQQYLVAKRKAAHRHTLREEDKQACLDTEDTTPPPVVSHPKIVAFSFNPNDFDVTCIVPSYVDEYLRETVTDNCTFRVALAKEVIK